MTTSTPVDPQGETPAAPPVPDGGRGPAVLPWLIRLVAALAVGLSGYLLLTTGGRNETRPAGCGAGSGCDAVLSSRWSRWFDMPVSRPAFLLYSATFAASLLVGPGKAPSRRRLGWTVLIALVVLAAGAGVYFTAVQAWELRAFCRYCTALHACGLLLACLVAAGVVADRRAAAPPVPAALGAGLIGLVGVCVLVVGQLRSEPPRTYALKLSNVTVDQARVPVLGPADAPHLVLVMSDYTCPHCRAMHAMMQQARRRYGDQVAVGVVPVPLNGKCNAEVAASGYYNERHRDACELAKLALAVWMADPSKFAEMDAWLFEHETPPAADEARRHAEALVGAEALRRAEAGPAVEQRLADYVALYKAAGGRGLPKVLLGPEMIDGRVEDPEVLFDLMEHHLKVKPVDEEGK